MLCRLSKTLRPQRVGRCSQQEHITRAAQKVQKAITKPVGVRLLVFEDGFSEPSSERSSSNNNNNNLQQQYQQSMKLWRKKDVIRARAVLRWATCGPEARPMQISSSDE